MPYVSFVRRHARLLAFGFLLAAGSSFGQTYFIALFGAPIRAAFELGHGDFGLLYSAVTLASAAALTWLGRRIDDVPLRRFASVSCLGLAGAAALMAGAGSIVGLAAALFCLRLCGQGLLAHTSATTMARAFTSYRGRAMSLAALGHSAGEAVLPAAAVVAIATIGWRATWGLTAVMLAVGLLPALRGLVDREQDPDRPSPVATAENDAGCGEPPGWTRRQVLGDPRFWLGLPAVVASPCLLTGLFFHGPHLFAEKGWSLTSLATAFVGYALATVVAAVAAGPAVDRFGARKVVAGSLVFLALALWTIASFDAAAAAMGYMVLAGVGVGGTMIAVGALWAEVYGVRHLGAIRAVATAFMVLSTAMAPAGFGLLIDANVTMTSIAAASGIAVIAAIVGFVAGYGRGRGPVTPCAAPT